MGRLWTKRETRFLTTHYPHTAVKILAERLRRSPSSVSNKLKSLGIRRNKKLPPKKLNRRWTMKEIEMLVRNYPHVTLHALATVLQRTPRAVMKKVYELRIRKQPHKSWSENDLNLLYGHNHKSILEISKELGWNPAALRAMRRKMREELK